MNRVPFFVPYPWALYSKKLQERIDCPLYAGKVEGRPGMRQVVGKEGSLEEGHWLELFWLVDEEDGVIVDASFSAMGPTGLIGAADIACEILIRKNYDQATRLSAELIDAKVRDTNTKVAFPDVAASYVNFVLFAIEEAAAHCVDIPFADAYVAPPLGPIAEGQGYPGWEALSSKQKIAVIEDIIAVDIRPYIELDAGGIQVLELRDDKEVFITYQGACTTCYSATGSTLYAIQQILRAKASPDLIVTPDIRTLRANKETANSTSKCID